MYSVPKSTPRTALTANAVDEKSQKRQSNIVKVEIPMVGVDVREVMIVEGRLLKE